MWILSPSDIKVCRSFVSIARSQSFACLLVYTAVMPDTGVWTGISIPQTHMLQETLSCYGFTHTSCDKTIFIYSNIALYYLSFTFIYDMLTRLLVTMRRAPCDGQTVTCIVHICVMFAQMVKLTSKVLSPFRTLIIQSSMAPTSGLASIMMPWCKGRGGYSDTFVPFFGNASHKEDVGVYIQ